MPPPAPRFADPTLTSLEHAAVAWLDGFYQLEHLLSARAWTIRLMPQALPALRFAALVHDAERFFPGGPSGTPQDGFDNPEYLFAHSIRSADIVEAWLAERTPRPDDAFVRRVRALILRHEIGGDPEEDVLQAADSLAFLDSFDWLVVGWVRAGHYDVAGALAKLDWMVARIRVPAAMRAALPIYAATVRALESARETTIDVAARRREAGDARRLIFG